MSVLSYLKNLGSNLVLTPAEKQSIKTSINTLEIRLENYFNNIDEKFIFGSFTRETILPRNYDSSSDVDYMIVFENPNDYKPQTFLNHLKDFVKTKYSSSEIYQSHPTIVLKLNHIKFELVPAVKDYWSNYNIPAPNSSYLEWIQTNPNEFNSKLSSVNFQNRFEIKPAVRLIKAWNAKIGKKFYSYSLEDYILNKNYYFCNNLKDIVFKIFEEINCSYDSSQDLKNKLKKAKEIIENVKKYEDEGYPVTAENEIKKLFE